MANENALEMKKLKSGVEVTVGTTLVTHLRTCEGGGINLPQVNVTTTASKNVEHSVGRVHYNELEITFINAASNLKVIQDCVKYMNDPMGENRFQIVVSEVPRGAGATGGARGHAVTYTECFPTEIELPKGSNDAGMLETRIRFSLHKGDHAAGGKK